MSNRIEVVRGTSFSKIIDLLDVNSQSLSVELFLGATAEFLVKTSPDASTNVVSTVSMRHWPPSPERRNRPSVQLIQSASRVASSAMISPVPTNVLLGTGTCSGCESFDHVSRFL